MQAGTQGTFSPPSPPGSAPGFQPQPPTPGPPPKKPDEPVWGAVALAAAVVPLPLWLFEASQDAALLLSILGGIIAIVFGSIGIGRTRNADGALGRGLAIGGLVVGIVVVGTAVIMVIIAFLVIAAIIAACAGCGSSSAVAVGMAGAGRQADWLRALLAHHPACGHYAQDVWRPFGVALCVGCFTALPVFLVILGALHVVAPPATWSWALGAVGLLLGSVQAASAVGAVRTRAAKAAVKSCVGVGLALTVHAVMTVPVPMWAHAAGGAFLLASILGSGWLRARRMTRHGQDHAAAVSPSRRQARAP